MNDCKHDQLEFIEEIEEWETDEGEAINRTLAVKCLACGWITSDIRELAGRYTIKRIQ